MKNLINQKIELFDQNGGVRSADGKYKKDWWEDNEIILTSVNNKYFFLRDLQTSLSYKHKIKDIHSISDNHITLFKEAKYDKDGNFVEK